MLGLLLRNKGLFQPQQDEFFLTMEELWGPMHLKLKMTACRNGACNTRLQGLGRKGLFPRPLIRRDIAVTRDAAMYA